LIVVECAPQENGLARRFNLSSGFALPRVHRKHRFKSLLLRGENGDDTALVGGKNGERARYRAHEQEASSSFRN
jgi:hypothetical protein